MSMNMLQFGRPAKSFACAFVIAGFASTAFAQGFLAPFFGSDPEADWRGDRRSSLAPSLKKKEKPRAGQQVPQTKPAAKQKVSRSAIPPHLVPLPIPRPWGNADAPLDDEDEATLAGEHDSAPDVGPAEAAAALTSPPSPVVQPAFSGLPKTEQSLVIIVRQAVRDPVDLEGRLVASGAARLDVRQILHASTGVTLKQVDVGWAAGLEQLARGEIDGVILGRGPKLLDSEAESMTNRDYRVLEIPLAPRAE